jgi:alkylation response protein AidB-like acyl-CoA dehydrogenase
MRTTAARPELPTGEDIAALFGRIDACRPALEATALEAEQLHTLPVAAVEALREIDIYALRTPRELGGLAADPVTQLRVFATIAAANPSAGWCAFVGAGAANVIGGRLPRESLPVVFRSGTRPAFSGLIAFTGEATATADGWRVSGRWPFASGVRHCDWLFVGCRVAGTAGLRSVVVRRDQVTVLDDWSTAGLQGTGSNTVVLDGVVVPGSMSWDPAAPAVRGGPGTEMGMGGNLTPAVCGFALGLAERAFGEIVAVARAKKRGAGSGTVGDRGAFRLELARQKLRVDAARALAEHRLDAAWATALRLGHLPAGEQNGLLAVATFCLEACLDAVRAVWPFLGAGEIRVEGVTQRCLRDLLCAAQHFHVSNATYEAHGQELLHPAE